jgi:hypothetical protein
MKSIAKSKMDIIAIWLIVIRTTAVEIYQELRHPTKFKDVPFSIRIALMVTIAFSIKCALYNWADPQLITYTFHGIQYGQREYPMGHWVHIITVPLFLGNYLLLTRPRGMANKCILPASFTLLVALLLSILNFRPPCPHLGLLYFVSYICIGSIITTWIHFVDQDLTGILNKTNSDSTRIEYLKEQGQLWRLIVVSGAFGFFWMLPNWWKDQEEIVKRIVSKKSEIDIVLEVFSVHFWIFLIFAILGPIYEGVNKIRKITDLILNYQKKD